MGFWGACLNLLWVVPRPALFLVVLLQLLNSPGGEELNVVLLISRQNLRQCRNIFEYPFYAWSVQFGSCDTDVQIEVDRKDSSIIMQIHWPYFPGPGEVRTALLTHQALGSRVLLAPIWHGLLPSLDTWSCCKEYNLSSRAGLQSVDTWTLEALSKGEHLQRQQMVSSIFL